MPDVAVMPLVENWLSSLALALPLPTSALEAE
jgi:hypothetical protein